MNFKEWIILKENQLPNKRVRYSGIILTPQSRELLVSKLNDLLQPLLEAGWKMANSPPPGVQPELLPHHMTISTKALPDNLRPLIGTEQNMVAVKWGQSDQAAAVAALSNVPSDNAVPHITVAVSPIGKPFQSNYISRWVDLPEKISLTGVVEEVV